MSKTEVEVYEPIEVIFKELGYSNIQFSICGDNFRIEFYLQNKSIHEIQHILLNFCDGYDIDWDKLEFKTSREVFNRINLKTLANDKTVWELFKERNIEIQDAVICPTRR